MGKGYSLDTLTDYDLYVIDLLLTGLSYTQVVELTKKDWGRYDV